MTVDNATNNITFHFQSSLSPTFVFETIGYDLYIASANWMVAHGTAAQPALSWKGGNYTLPWNSAGFTKYQDQANQADYNQYFVNNVLASGPYEISYTVPSSSVVLVKNPSYVSPNKWVSAASIDTVVIQYVGQPSTNYLLLSSGQAQSAGLPSSNWGQVVSMENQGIVHDYGLPTLSIFWYNYNANVNETMLKGLDPSANLPFSMFTNLNLRKAFSYAYNYVYSVQSQFGNPSYPTTTFAEMYAGMLPAGMAFSQSIHDLNTSSNTTGVPYFDLAMAKHYWELAVGSGSDPTSLASLGVNDTGTYNSKALNIPVYIFSADPDSLAATTSWVQYLHGVTGITFSVIPTDFTQLLAYEVQGNNPMPVYELGWAPDYPYPSDYLGPMALPVNATTYPGPNDFTSWWIGGGNQSTHLNTWIGGLANISNPIGDPVQAKELNWMIEDYSNATSTPNTVLAAKNYHMMNDMLVNLTFYTYLFQQYIHFTMSTKIKPSTVITNEMNIMVMGQQGLRYYELQYS